MRTSLGMKPTSEDMVGAWYDTDSSQSLLFPTPMAGTAKNTVMEWTVDDVVSEVANLTSKGVTFDTFEMEGITWDNGVASMGGRARVRGSRTARATSSQNRE